MTQEPTAPNQKSQKDELLLVYNNIVTRLLDDDNTSWRIITVSGALLTIIAGFAAAAKSGGSLGIAGMICLVCVICSLGMAIFAGLFSLSPYHDLSAWHSWWWARPIVRLLLGKKGRSAYDCTERLLERDSVFHTVEILRRVSAHGVEGAGSAYLSTVRHEIDGHFADFIIFLASLIEIKKFSRSIALMLLAVGGFSLWVWFAYSFMSRALVN